jgi:hypothetical protein
MTEPSQIRRTLELFSGPGWIIEIRALDCWDNSEEFKSTRIGYFDINHLAEAEAAAIEAETKWHASGVYLTINPVMVDVRGRSANRMRKAQKGESTKDTEILTRRVMLLDFDPKRPAGISSSETELQAAHELARRCGIWLCDHGFSLPVIAMSGNGIHLVYLIDLPTDDADLVKKCLLALDQIFSSTAVHVDTGVFNQSRITKLYGTMTRKGDSTEDRPNRRSELIEVPEDWQIVPRERLEWLAAQYVEPIKPTSSGSNHQGSGEAVDVESYLSRHGVEVIGRDSGPDGTRKWFIPCPGESSHTTRTNPRDCVITQEPTGRLGGKCFHSSCGMSSWNEIRGAIGPIQSTDFPKSNPVANQPENPKIGEARSLTPKNQVENRGKLPTASMFIPFPMEILPGVVREFCEHHARSICCDPTLVLLPVLAVMATAIGNSRRVVCRKSWSEPAILWTLPVADSGSGKSPAFDAARYPLTKLQKDEIRAYDQAMSRYKAEKRQYEQQQKGRKGIESIPEPVPPELQDVFLEDCTVEAIAPALLARPRGSAIVCEELSGWFARLNAYKQKGGGDEAFYLGAHGGRSSKVNRKGGGKIFIPSTVLSITGTIQRPIIKQVLSSTHIGSGMAARFLYSMPPEQVRQWSDEEIPHEVIDDYNQMIYRLASLEMQTVDEFSEPVFIGMSKPAHDLFRAFYDEIGANRPDIETAEMKAAWSKLEGGAARLALVFACCRYVQGEKSREVVDLQDMEAGIAASRWFAHEAERIYGMLVESEHEAELRELISWIQSQGGSISPSELRDKKRRYREAGAADAVLQSLVNTESGYWGPTLSTPTGGKPARRFHLSSGGRSVTYPQNPIGKEGLATTAGEFDDSTPATWAMHEELSAADLAEINDLFGGRPA